MPQNKGADSNQWDLFSQLVWDKTLWMLLSIPFEIPLRCQGAFDFPWEIGVLPAHGLLEVPSIFMSVPIPAPLNLPTGLP